MKYITFTRTVNLIKARLKKIGEFVEGFHSADSEIHLEEIDIQKILVFQAEVKLKQTEFDKNVRKLIDVSNLPADYDDDAVINAQDDIHDLCASIQCKIQLLLVKPDNNDTNNSIQSHSTELPAASAAVRLPKIELKHFDGDSHTWISFINLFDTTIHQNASLSPVAKFQYLLGTLSGDALNLVKSLPITGANYSIAYDTLRERYHSVRRLASLHLNKIIDLPSVTLLPTKNLRTFLNIFNENTQALKALKCDITESNPLLATLLLKRMDSELRNKFESSRTDTQSLPTVNEIVKMLSEECSHAEDASLHSTENKSLKYLSHSAHTRTKPHSTKPHSRSFAFVATEESTSHTASPPCFCCSRTGHKIYSCQLFKDKSPQDRHKLVKSQHRCFSCLGNHDIRNCRSKFSCNKCHRKHHSLLHFDQPGSETPQAAPPPPAVTQAPDTPTSKFVGLSTDNTDYYPPQASSTVLLATTLVKLTSDSGNTHVFRALIDSCSQCDFLSERAAQLLRVRRVKSNLHINGIAQSQTCSKGLTHVNIETLRGNIVSENQPMLILDKITYDLPRAPVSPELFELVKNYTLADPTFHISGPIDVLLGGALFPYIFTGEKYSLGPNMPFLMSTLFGYTLMGSAPCISYSQPPQNTHVTTLLSLNDFELHSAIQRFWQQEEPPTHSKLSEEEILCDNHFSSSHTRDEDGKYVVKLPFKSDASVLGDSMMIAKHRLSALERRFETQPLFKKAYVEFMEDYSNSGHMTQCDSIPDQTSTHFFLPHHGVLKNSSSTTKLRTVFDASSKTSTGISLNDILLTGPKLQTNIFDILFHFRRHNVVFTCDIRQMYRMIKVAPEHQCYQMIFWRNGQNLPVSAYKLTTVTYGMNCSPYLALRTLRQLAEDEGVNFPEAAKVLKNNTYVDDIVVGHETEEKALALQDQLIQLLRKGGFELRKWTSNSSMLLGNLPSDHHEVPKILKPWDQPFFSILGLFWSASMDCFSYNFRNNASFATTKRQILSAIAQINYDPCGFLSPITMWAKIYMQLLWAKGLNWDEPLPEDLSNKWNFFSAQLELISEVKIPRSLNFSLSGTLQVHGFSDASENGYSAVVYTRFTDENNIVAIRQLISKARVAPLKKVSLPRLELCGSHLLAKLMSYCLTLLSPSYQVDQVHAWCDSTIALSWIQTPSYRLKTYVANRVSEIQELVPSHLWAHVKSTDNPADCASRGILPSELKAHPLWWTGPKWLMDTPEKWPVPHFIPIHQDILEEVKPIEVTALHSTKQAEIDFSKFSSWSKLVRVFSYVLRFVNNLKQPQQKITGYLSAQELKDSSLMIFKIVQRSSFSDEIELLKNNKICSTQVQRLTPFIDDAGVVRVGGRLNHSSLNFDVIHQVILPKKHHVVTLLVDYFHLKYLHAPPQLLQSLLAQKVWILSARSLIRSRVFKCIKCFRAKPRNTNPLMGDLPSPRTTQSRAFSNVGIDFCGPFIAKAYNLRTLRTFKIYVCIFVCLATKAVHFEVTSDLSSDAFIAALTRFVSRRGLCRHIYCDNGTNFVGANTLLKKTISDYCSDNSMEFHFNPPSAPHQGGLWEAAVKSMKFHLRRVVGDTILTIEEYNTIIVKIEAIMNSRPLVPLSSDPSDLSALTPGHFLIGAPLNAVPEDDVTDIPVNRLKRWQRLQAFTQVIWRRWTKDYLHTLQQKGKWSHRTEDLKIGDLVLVQDNNSSPLSWPLARIVSVYPGSDNVVRVVKVHTKNGFLTRPAVKIYPLPVD